ncbi:kinase-like domain-containing protein [Pseudomassariella vexata]|uniref:Kinase-like domain-containing protein n=1 Tax=Pseudomassariella vexata TaxID=1141098 RepID=A0A1Y2DR52_9PEZI|nr:kinase-like domain-containing protein [Pseudomassariella vexata]ORY61717.1 kinase-like domain-containing protein [Pseudomassariella vexata]
MAPLDKAEEDALIQQILEQLSQTPYACSSLTKLSGGTANFLYRGTLLQSLYSQDGATKATTKTVVVKSSTNFAAANRDFPLDVTRCVFEETMLRALVDFLSTTPNTVVKAPRLYLFDRRTNTQVLKHLLNTTDLRSILLSPSVNNFLPQSSPASVGHALGYWLRSFHRWISAPAQAALRAEVGSNEGMRKHKFLITYGSFLEILELYPELVEDHRKTLEDVEDAMKKEFDKPPIDGDDDWGLIHGDFWTGNVLLPNTSWQEPQQPGQESNKLFIIDWENAQFGHRAIDIGGMLADLYERKHFNDVDAVIPAMHGLVQGYGRLSEEMAFRTAIHVGVHLICWYYRRDRTAPLRPPLNQVLAALTLGRDFVLKGWEKDRNWFESSVLTPLFAGK